MSAGETFEVNGNPTLATGTGEGKGPADDVGFPVIPLRNMVLFPGIITSFTVGRQRSIAAVEEAVRHQSEIAILTQRDPEKEQPDPADLYPVGTMAEILRMLVTPDSQRLVLVRGRGRFRSEEFPRKEPFLTVRPLLLPETIPHSNEFEARVLGLRQDALQAISLLPQNMPELASAIENAENPSLLIDLVASALGISIAEKQEFLETIDLEERVRKLAEKLAHQIEVLSLTKKIGTETREAIDKGQREYFLRQQLKAIQKELGEEEPKAAEIRDLRKKIDEAKMPPEAEKQARSELGRLERMPEGAAEASIVRTYLDWLTELPWNISSAEKIEIPKAREVLEADHHDLEKVKKRILEFLAVRKLKPEGKSPILCFVGPPGVGKTSLGQSIARAMNRKFVRQSLGGVHDEAEIRGHRRTYIGALPGRIIQGIRKAGTKNPVFMLDEIDKLSASFHGDPSAALLEVLDPEQNFSFEDHYIDVPFDLGQVLFIATANVLEAIPPPLRDRMEVLDLPGYTEVDKLAIARRFLVGRQIAANGLGEGLIVIEDDAIREVIRGYTREAGVRQLERELGSICRATAMRVAEGKTEPAIVRAGDVRSFLGQPKFTNEVALRTSLAGVATGLAWTPSGGDILFVEATRMPGDGKLILTGQLGDVMKESAQAGLSLVKSRAAALKIEPGIFKASDIHIHVPAGAIPKDGPSAGVTIFVALVSLLLGRRVRRDIAMTGEISLRGLVLPVGGIKEKVLAAKRAGIDRVILPKLNEKDLDDIPPSVRSAMRFEFVEHVDEALALALEVEAEGEAPSGTPLEEAARASPNEGERKKA
jgi:ATP-dependent Lon protease